MSGFSNILIMSQVKILVLRGEIKLVPPRESENANYLIIRSIYLRVMRGDLHERMGEQQFLNFAGGVPKRNRGPGYRQPESECI